MLIVIISVILIGLGIGLCVYYNNSWTSNNVPLDIGIASMFIGGIALIVSLFIIIPTQCTKDINHINNAERREMLIYRLEHQDEDLVGNELLYQEIRDFNEDLRRHKEYSDSPWIGWFLNEKNATFDYIDYRGGGQ